MVTFPEHITFVEDGVNKDTLDAIESGMPVTGLFATPDQWAATLRNTPGVKAEEMKWLGLDDWLKGQKGTVTKAQVADFVRANQIEVKDVVKGKTAPDRRAELELIAGERPIITACLQCGDNAPETGFTCDACREDELNTPVGC